jgi:hypothetical protein
MKRYAAILGAAAVLGLSAWGVWKTPFNIALRSKVILETINSRIPPQDLVGVFNSGYLQYFTDRRVVNLDGLVNNEILPYYQRRRGLEYLRKRKILWMVDLRYYFTRIFGRFFGPEAVNSLELVDVIKKIVYFKNDVAVVAVLPEGFHPPAEMTLPIQLDTTALPEGEPFP